MSKKNLGMGIALLVIAALVAAWVTGGTRAAHWIEVPLVAPTSVP